MISFRIFVFVLRWLGPFSLKVHWFFTFSIVVVFMTRELTVSTTLICVFGFHLQKYVWDLCLLRTWNGSLYVPLYPNLPESRVKTFGSLSEWLDLPTEEFLLLSPVVYFTLVRCDPNPRFQLYLSFLSLCLIFFFLMSSFRELLRRVFSVHREFFRF